ncbi:MAG: peptidoglycan editing factor PgeF [Candidatus Omnitrophota bacterium]
MPEHKLSHKKYLHLASLDEKRLTSAFSNRLFQNMSLYYGHTRKSLINRRHFLSCLGINHKDLVCARQAHGSRIKYVNEAERGKGALAHHTSIRNTDALVTDMKNLPLAIFTADCLSIFLYDPKSPAIAVIHAGWKGTYRKIAFKAVQFMRKRFNTHAPDLRASFGPAIRGCCYEVGREFARYFRGNLEERNGRLYLDLPKANKKQLMDAGVKEANIFDGRVCTSCNNSEFFSFRKEGKSCGRIMSVMMLK